jgi:hypothetical protein
MSIPRLAHNWELPPSSLLKEVSFDATAPSDLDTIVWKLDLPEDNPTKDRELKHLEEEIRSTRKALERIPLEIERLGYRRSQATSGELSFRSEQVTASEAEFFYLLESISSANGGLSFDLSGKSRLDWQKAAEEFEDALTRTKTMLTKFALVETSIQGELIGRTVVSWSGKTESSWLSARGPEQVHLHQRSLRAALASRFLLLNMLVITAQSAARLSALLAIPGGVVMALPAVWKYITRLIDELEKYQEQTRQGV